MNKNLFMITVLLLIYIDVSAQVYYIKVGGDDTNDGLSPSTAFATIQHFAAIAVSGDIGNITGGTYNESNITLNKVAGRLIAQTYLTLAT